MQNSRLEQKGGKRKSIGKRKLSDPDETYEEQLPPQQRTISDLFSPRHRNSNETAGRDLHHLSPSTKRYRVDNRPDQSPRAGPTEDLIAPDKMYSFPSSELKGKSVAGDTRLSSEGPTAAMRPKGCNSSPRASNFTPHTGAKKLVVKNLRAVPRLDPDSYFEKVWLQLDSALSAIFSDEKPAQSLEELYRGVENVCRQGRASGLAKNLQAKCTAHISDTIRQHLKAKIGSGDEVETIRAVVEAWSTWSSRLVTVRSIFYYLDQSFLLHSNENPVIYEMGLVQFRTHIFADSALKPKIVDGVCHLVDFDRRGDTRMVDSALLRQAIGLFHNLGIYNTDFEEHFVKQSDGFFKEWAAKDSTNSYLATYVTDCLSLIRKEMERCELYALDRSTKQQLSIFLDCRLVKDQQHVLLETKEVLGLMRTGNLVALGELYSLLERMSLGSKLKTAFDQFIIDEGSAIVFDEKRESEMVVRLLDFKQSLDAIWMKAFQKNELLGHSLRESFETFLNKPKKTASNWGTDNLKPGEMIAKYVDMILRGQLKTKSDSDLVDMDSEVDRQLGRVLDLFRFVHGKAVFEAFYKNDLARRLLMDRSASDEAEKNMLSRLKTECGSGFTQNLESMFKDMDLARDEMASYKAIQLERRDRPPVDFNAHVLSSAAWPSYPDVPVNVPPAIKRSAEHFERFYNSKYKGRKLTWKHQLAHCQLKARFPKGDKEIVVSSFQAIVLMLFNDDCTLSYKQIQAATGLSDAELVRTLQSLACAKFRVLKKHTKGPNVNENDQFSYNADFHDQKVRFKINQIQLKETKQENQKTHERVAADRHFETQAAIVRIMKSRKTITHPELVAEVIKATKSRGVLDPADIKKNIEKLIDKDYLEREEGNRYQYLA